MLFNDTFNHHCETFPHGSKSCYTKFKNCKTNPGHKGFMPVDTFRSEVLNQNHEKYTLMEKYYIQLMIDSTVKITLDYTSMGRPDTFPRCKMRYPCVEFRARDRVPRSGTGYLPFYVIKEVQGSSCPCHICKTSDTPKQTYWVVPVSTATHVVFDDNEAKRVLVELFYDSESREGVRYLYGVHVYGDRGQRYNTDYCVLQCVTHEADLVDTLKRMMEQKKQFKGKHAPTGIMISHPHGMSKMVSSGCVDQKCFIPDSDTLLASLLKHLRGIDIFCPDDNERRALPPHVHGRIYFDKRRVNYMMTGNVLPLPGGYSAVIPCESLVQLRRHFFGDKCFWGTISPVTLFSQTRNGTVQSELVFYVPVKAEEKISFDCFSSLSYSMPACPGCSGARVSAQFCPTDCDTDDLFGHNHHFGYDGEQSLSGRVKEGHMTLRDIKNNRIKIWI